MYIRPYKTLKANIILIISLYCIVAIIFVAILGMSNTDKPSPQSDENYIHVNRVYTYNKSIIAEATINTLAWDDILIEVKILSPLSDKLSIHQLTLKIQPADNNEFGLVQPYDSKSNQVLFAVNDIEKYLKNNYTVKIAVVLKPKDSLTPLELNKAKLNILDENKLIICVIN